MSPRGPRLPATSVLVLLCCAPQAAALPAPGARGHALAEAPTSPTAARGEPPREPPQSQGAAPSTDIAIPAIDALVRTALAQHKLPGCVVAVGRSRGLVFLHAYGQRALVPWPVEMTNDTIFDLASLTKAIATASSVVKLAQDGKLRIEDRISRHLPELDRPATRAITIRELLLHGAGLAAEDSIRDYQRGPKAALAAVLAQRPIAEPGAFLYSDIGYIWLGELVRRASGQPLDAFARAALFEPLGMRDTRFNPGKELLSRIAPTEVTDDRGAPQQLIAGVVHDPRAFLLGGVAGNAGLFSTAADLSRFARMLLGHGVLDGVRVLSEQSVTALTRPVPVGDSVRTLGWDVHSRYSRLRGTRLTERAFGHGGYTGTSLWIDPGQDLFVLLLSNRVHPDGKGNVIGLAGAIADAAVSALGKKTKETVLAGIDVLRQDGFAALRGKRIGVLTHMAARTADGESSLQALTEAKGVQVAAIFSPEHGLEGTHEGPVSDAIVRGVPQYSLYGATRQPTAQMLRGLDLVVIDLVDVGTRFYTYMSTLHAMLRAAAASRVPVLVLDRPNPLGGVEVEGPVLDDGMRSFVNHHPLPIRHGMSAGELSLLIASDEQLGAMPQVIDARGWCREQLFAQTGLRWTNPSPNLRSPEAALLYPAIGLLESTNLSVGRGTDHPFAELGAPFIDSSVLLAALQRAHLPGVRFAATSFTPTQNPYAGERCQGVHLELTDARAFRPVRTGLEIAHTLHQLYPARWQADKLMELLGHAQSMRALLAGADEASLEPLWQPRLGQFLERRRRFLHYPSCEQP